MVKKGCMFSRHSLSLKKWEILTFPWKPEYGEWTWWVSLHVVLIRTLGLEQDGKTLLITNIDMEPCTVDPQLRVILQWLVASEVEVAQLAFHDSAKKEFVRVSACPLGSCEETCNSTWYYSVSHGWSRKMPVYSGGSQPGHTSVCRSSSGTLGKFTHPLSALWEWA